MSVTRRNSTSPSTEPKQEMKVKLISCINRLSDRDTLKSATNELEAIARDLTQDSFTTFLSCIHTTDSGEKSLVRRQCVKVLALLAETHGDELAPHLVKMLSIIVKRLKDCDTSVRSACVEVVAVMARRIGKRRFGVFFKVFMDVVTVEQDYNLQIGSALCLAAAIDAASDPEVESLGKAVPKFLRLVKSECFKAKPALVSLLGSILGVGGCSNKGVLDSVVKCGVEFLSSEDWAVRKSAVEVLERLVVTDREMAVEYKMMCVAALESRRFDKVKVVRDAMNRTLKLWKEVGIDDGDELSPSSESPSQSSSRETVSSGCSPLKSPARSTLDAKQRTPQSKKTVLPGRSPPSSTSSRERTSKTSPLKKSGGKPSITLPPKNNGNSNWKVEVVVPRTDSPKVLWDDKLEEINSDLVKQVGNEDKSEFQFESESLLSSDTVEICVVKNHGGLKVGSRVFPVHEDANSERTFAGNMSSDDTGGDNEIEGLSIIQQQLLHIENQQSNLLHLLQRFMGSSQNGMSALESRVQGLEMALDEISHDLAMSNGRISSSETCCKLPGAEFLSPKFWRRSEAKIYNSRMNSPDSSRSPASRRIPFKDECQEAQKVYLDQSQRYQSKDFQGSLWGISAFSGRDQNFNQGAQRVHTSKPRKFNGSSNGSSGSALFT